MESASTSILIPSPTVFARFPTFPHYLYHHFEGRFAIFHFLFLLWSGAAVSREHQAVGWCYCWTLELGRWRLVDVFIIQLFPVPPLLAGRASASQLALLLQGGIYLSGIMCFSRDRKQLLTG